jgi:FtsP/CotA-like multicopper oxidase with cupredoxin domain
VLTRYSRRRALQLAGLGLATAAAGAVGVARDTNRRIEPSDGAPAGASESFTEPTLRQSSGGVLDVTLTATAGTGPVGGRTASTLRYNDVLPGPTLRCRPGDILRVTLVNRLTEPTNLHVHGLQVSPEGNGDNPFVMIEPGQSFRYEYLIPTDHPSGTFWYHPHHHGLVADQVFGGLYGAIVIDDPNPVPVAADRLLVVSDITLDGSGAVAQATVMQRRLGREGATVLVNGQLSPRLTATPGSRERWRLINACTSRYLRLRLDGQDLTLLGIDLPTTTPVPITEVLLAPGNRADLLVTARTGESTLAALPVDRGASMMSGGMGRGAGANPPTGTSVELATLAVRGPEAPAPGGIPHGPAPRDLRGLTVSRRRQVTLAMTLGMGVSAFTLDGRSFDPSRTDQTVVAGDVEEWTFTNATTMDHPMHLHVWPMQLITTGGVPETGVTWRDVVNVPAGATTTVRIAFDRNAGRSVYHCHILDHEDLGMMAVVQIASSRPSSAGREPPQEDGA